MIMQEDISSHDAEEIPEPPATEPVQSHTSIPSIFYSE